MKGLSVAESTLTCAGHVLGVLLGSIIGRVAATLRKTVIGGFAVFRARLAGVRARLVLEFTYRALLALLLVHVGLKARLAVATAGGKVPFPVSLAEKDRIFDYVGVGDAGADRLLDKSDLATGRRGRKTGEVHGDLRTADIVHLDGQDRYAGALIAKREVNALLRHRYRFHLRVYHHFGIRIEPAFARSYATCKCQMIPLPKPPQISK